MSKRIALIDLDTPCYSSAAVCEERSVLVTHVPSQKTKVFKTRTEFKDRLKELDRFDKLEEYTFLDQQEPQPIENACQVLKTVIGKIEEAVQADHVMTFIGGKENFRDYLPLPTKYKSSRADTLRPLLLKQVREFAINKFKAEVCNYDEADDRIIYRAYELSDKGHTPIVVTIDKDALAYSGLLLFNQDKPEDGIIKIPNLGSLWVDDKDKVRGNGFIWYCFQMIVGDPTDSYKPTELCGVKFGEKSAYKLLKDCKTEYEALTKVIEQYKVWYPNPVEYKAWDGRIYTKDYIDLMQLYHRCVRMKAHEYDELIFHDFCLNYGVQL